MEKSSAKLVADEAGISLSMAYKWAEAPEEGSGSANPLDRVEQLIQATGDARIAQWVCEKAGGVFVENPQLKGRRAAEVLPATSQIMQEFADMLSVIAQAGLDNDISPKETASIRRRWEELKSVTEGFVRSCEQGDFGKVRADLRAAAKAPHQTER